MLSVNNLKLAFGKRILFKDVNIKFRPGNCYGLIGANGSGKSTFLKIVAGEIEQTEGEVIVDPGERIAVLRQDQFAFDEFEVIDTVIMGHKELHDVLRERDEIYSRDDFTDEDGMRASELEELVEKFNGYEAETEAEILLSGLGIAEDLHRKKMKELEGGEKVKVLLAQAIFGNPDILLLDEPTNHLDLESMKWLENYLADFNNTVIVVSHDRHFLNNVCTHIADIDFGKIEIYVGNYSFWLEASELALQQKRDENKKVEDKRKELQAFVERFSSNASKARQATSRKKLLEKLTLEDIKPSSRKFPFIEFKPLRETGKVILEVENLNKTVDGEHLLKDFNLLLNRDDKIIFLSYSHIVQTTLFQILMGELKPDSGTFRWGETITTSYFPKENSGYFENDMSVLHWIKQFTTNPDEAYARGFLGRMLFTGEESLKSIKVLSGGEKVRCMLSRMMLSGANALIFDEPTSHLDLEAITSLNNALIKYPEIVLFTSHDYEFINTIANRVIEITPEGVIDRRMTFEEYVENDDIKKLRDEMYHGHNRLVL
ncbi:MAG TPA: ATP-binding cassette domain-containing protein [Spirochaetota bacterium]|nr:ATP-binding cassette domain-containing protein [Spirochaetota bacterium]HPJ35580.1 ATP-binding cassette domain-containing protein [Spirochaetota bacterium]